MNINTVQNTYNKAREAQKSGQTLLAARLFLVAQRDAKQCRSAERIRIMDCAHAGAVMNSAAVLKSDAGHSAKSEAGRIKAESYNSYRAGI